MKKFLLLILLISSNITFALKTKEKKICPNIKSEIPDINKMAILPQTNERCKEWCKAIEKKEELEMQNKTKSHTYELLSFAYKDTSWYHCYAATNALNAIEGKEYKNIHELLWEYANL